MLSALKWLYRFRSQKDYILGLVLMENAGGQFFGKSYPCLDFHLCAILVGKGNNGGDGLLLPEKWQKWA